MRETKNLLGQKFNRLTVIEYAGMVKNGKQKQSAWKCVCECGNVKIIPSNRLKTQNTKSCGCLHSEIVKKIKSNLTGLTFGLLKVIKISNIRNGNSIWECECKCGKTCFPTGCSLKSGGSKSCGCKMGWWRSPCPGLWKNPAAYQKWKLQDPKRKLKHRISCSIRGMIKNNGSCKRRKSIMKYLPYSIEELKLHLENQWEPWMNWDNYGGKSNDPEKTWHIDHIKPHSCFNYTSMEDKGFLECWDLSNLKPLEKKANMSKGNKYGK